MDKTHNIHGQYKTQKQMYKIYKKYEACFIPTPSILCFLREI